MNTLRAILVCILTLVMTLVLVPLTMAGRMTGYKPLSQGMPVLWYRWFLKMARVDVHIEGEWPTTPALVVSNHCSWLDIPVLGSQGPVSFVAKADIASWPVIGFIAKVTSTIFVSRERRLSTGDTRDHIRMSMERGRTVILFPEGTTSDGNKVLPFKSALFGAVHYAGTPVVPLGLAYTKRGGLNIARNQRRQIAWYGDMALLPHFWGILTGPPIDVTLALAPPLESGDRKTLARQAEVQVRAMVANMWQGHAPLPLNGQKPYVERQEEAAGETLPNAAAQ